jgi:PIN domain nuclease of toxin-antitoxin system
VSTAPVLDTHAWIWWVEHDPRLGRAALEALDALPADHRPFLSDISLWEVAMLVERRRLTLSVPLEEWFEATAHPRSVRIVPITPLIAAKVADLPASFHRDPADRVIVATCQALDAPLLTRDRLIGRSRLIKKWTVKAA